MRTLTLCKAMTADERRALETLRASPTSSLGLRKTQTTSVLVRSGMALIHSPSVMLVGSSMPWREKCLEMSGKCACVCTVIGQSATDTYSTDRIVSTSR